MNREIKFRAWFSGIPAMVEFKLGENNIDVYDSHDDKFTVDINNADSIMQYTGLKDRNGKEIYDGDQFNGRCSYKRYPIGGGDPTIEYKDCIATVVFDRGRFCGHSKESDNVIYIDNTIEVIGNIHENPELL